MPRFNASFTWTVKNVDALVLKRALLDRAACNLVSSLFDGDDQVDGITSHDVTTVEVRPSKLDPVSCMDVTAFATFDLDDTDEGAAQPEFTPALLDGFTGLPALSTYGRVAVSDLSYEEAEQDVVFIRDTGGEASDWSLLGEWPAALANAVDALDDAISYGQCDAEFGSEEAHAVLNYNETIDGRVARWSDARQKLSWLGHAVRTVRS